MIVTREIQLRLAAEALMEVETRILFSLEFSF